MFSLKSKKHGDRLSALIGAHDGAATATVRRDKGGRALLEHCAFYNTVPGQDDDALLRRSVQESGIGKHPCSTLLAPTEYQLLMVEAPEVPPAELRAAIRWRIRDLIDFHVDDAVLDVFDSPPSGARAVQEHLYVVVTRASVVKEHVERLQGAGAALEVIDIPEMALRNIAAQLPQETGGQALLYFSAREGLITLTRETHLYLARTLDIGYEDLRENPDLVDRLALELQRSMDYYDRHFQQAPISALTLCPLPEPLPWLSEQLSQQTGVTVHTLRIADLIDARTALEDSEFARCLLAIGTALRTEAAEL